MSDLNIRLNLDTTAAEASSREFRTSVDDAKKDIEKPTKINISLGDSLTKLSDSFNEIRGAVTGFSSMISDALSSMAAMADEQNRLSTQSARLNLDFDAAAGAAGRFVDETTALTVATQFAARGINLTQVQLNDLMHVAGATAQTLGTSVTTEANNLTEALIRGRSNGLAPFGEAFVAVSGEAHTVNERLAVLRTTSEEVATATDNATTSMERFQDSLDDAKRTFATAFVEELQRMSHLGEETSRVATDLNEVNINLRAAGSTAANIVSQLTLGVQGVGAMAYLAVAPIIDLVNLAMAATHGLSALSRERDRIATSGRSAEALRMVEQIGNRLEALQSDTGSRAADVVPGAVRVGAQVIEITGRVTHAQTSASQNATRLHQLETAQHNEKMRQIQQESQEREHSLALREANIQRLMGVENMASMRSGDIADREHRQRMDAVGVAVIQEDMAQQLAQKERDRLSGEQSRQREQLRQHRSYSGNLREMLGDEIQGKKELANGTMMVFDNMGKALGAHATALAQGKETVGEALKGMLADTLTSLGQEAIVKGAMEMAHGFAALAGVYTAGLAPGHFAAGAAYMAVGAAASVAGAALSPAPAVSGGGGGAGGGAAARAETPNRSTGSSDQAPKNITINMNAFQSNESAQALIVRSLREAGYAGRSQVGMLTSR